MTGEEKTMASIAMGIEGITDESRLDAYNITAQEKQWLDSIAEHHSYFLIELESDNTLRKAYLMDATDAPTLTEQDKRTYNFERRVEDDGVVKKKLKMKDFKKFWNKHLTVGFDGKYGVEYIKDKKVEKIYRCRPFGWVIEEVKSIG